MADLMDVKVHKSDDAVTPLLHSSGSIRNSVGSIRSSGASIHSSISSITEWDRESRVALRRTSWWFSAAIIAGEIMGTGVLGLPAAAAALVLGCGSTVLFAALAIYSGLLLSRVKNEFYPDAMRYSELAEVTVNRAFSTFTYCCIILNWSLLLPYYLMTAVTTLGLAFHTDLCYYDWALIMGAALLVPAQVRSLHGLTVLAFISNIAVIAALVLILVSFIADGRAEDVEVNLWPGSSDFITFYGSLASFIFSFQGQSMFLEIMTEMQDSRKFPASVCTANIFMSAVYFVTTGLSYYYRGNAVADFLPQSLTHGPLRTVVCILICFHVVVSYLLTAQPLMFTLHERIWPKTVYLKTWTSQLHWGCITVGAVVMAFLVANAIPFFSAFQNIIGSLLGSPIVFGWPALFFLRASYIHDSRVSWFDFCMCWLFLLVVFPTTCILGLYNAVTSLIDDWQTFGKPFGCTQTGY